MPKQFCQTMMQTFVKDSFLECVAFAGIQCLEMRNKMSELLINLFEGVIDEKAIDKLSTEELQAIEKMLKEAGY